MTHALVLDTMVYLHYKPVDQIDWHAVLGVPGDEAVLLVATGIALRELDKHKNESPRLRERAARASQQLAGWMERPDDEVRAGVRMVAALRTPAVDFPALGLDPSVNDDVLVASALAFRSEHPAHRVVVVTQDSFPRMRAKSFGLDVLEPPASAKLPPQDDDVVRENRELRRKLEKLEAARASIDAEYADGTKALTVAVGDIPPMTEESFRAAMAEAEGRCPPTRPSPRPTPPPGTPPAQRAPDASRPPVLSEMARDLARMREESEDARREMIRALGESAFGAFGLVNERELARYEAERAEYLKDFAAFVRARHLHQRELVRRFEVAIRLVNDGTRPAEDVDVFLHVPDGVEVSRIATRREPKEPTPPAPPRRGVASLVEQTFVPSDLGRHLTGHGGHSAVRDLMRLAGAGRRGNVSDLEIEETGSYLIRCNVEQVKHGVPAALPPFYVTVPPDAPVRPFQIEYTLHASNIPEPVRGTLNVVLAPA